MSPGTTLSPLGYRPFAIVWASLMASHFAASIQGVGAQWLMTAMDGRGDMVGLIHTATTLPVMLLALAGGAIADIYDRRKVMVAGQALAASASLLLAALAWTGNATPWLLIALTFMLGTGLAFFQPAVNASIPVLVPRTETSGAIGLNVVGFNTARTIGPAIGGALVAAGGTFGAFLASAAFSLLSAALLFLWTPPAAAGSAVLRNLLPAILEGLRTVRRTPELRSIFVRGSCFTLCGSAIWGLMPLVARDLIGGGAGRFGMLLGALGLGALVGSAASHAFRRRFSPEGLARISALVFGLGAMVIASGPGLWATMAVLVAGGAFWVQALSGFGVSAQIWSPQHLIGRTTSVVTLGIWGGLALGAWLWGHFAEVFGTSAAIAASGMALLAVGAVGLVMPLPNNQMAGDADRH